MWYYLSTRWILRKFNLDTRKETYFTKNGKEIIDENESQNKSIPISDDKLGFCFVFFCRCFVY